MDERYVKTTYPRTTLRSNPEPTSEALAVMPEGSDVEILERGQKYCKVTAWHAEQGYVTGYVANHFIGVLQAAAMNRDKFARMGCVVCGSSTVEYMAAAPYGNVYLATGAFSGVALKAKLCLECGNVTFAVPEDDLQLLRDRKKN